MAFYKMQQGQHEFFFQLVNLEVREDFALWDNTNKKFIRQVEGVNDINDLKFMQKDLFAQRYPNFRKVSQYIRDVVIDVGGVPTQHSFGFKKSANDQIIEEIRGRQQLGKDPLDYIYKYRKTGEGLATTHVVVLMQEVGKAQNVVTQQQADRQYVVPPLQPFPAPIATGQGLTPSIQQKPLEQPVIKLEVPSTSKLVLTSQEQQVLSLFNQDTQIYGEDLFVDIFNKTLSKYFNQTLMPDRIKQIYKEYYAKAIPFDLYEFN